jgi:hypothetical protein
MTERVRSLLLGALGALFVTAAVAAPPPSSEPPRVVKAWGVMFQVMDATDRYVATKELSSIHNEDGMLRAALSVLQTEKGAVVVDKRAVLEAALGTFGRQVADLHESADAFDQAKTEERLRAVKTTYNALTTLYPKDVLTQARTLADRSGCPMHRDVVGKPNGKCPKCGMELDQPIRIPLMFSGGGVPALHTVSASIQTDASLEVGKEVKGTLRLKQITGAPVLITDLRVVHTERIHLLIIDPSLTDYHHVHPRPTAVPGAFEFSFTPTKPGTYRAFADLRTTLTGFQEYAQAEIPATTPGLPLTDKTVKLRAEVEGLRYVLTLDKPRVTVGTPVRAKLRVTDLKGKPFKQLEPIMATFAHLVAFNEDGKTVLHIHPKMAKLPAPEDRGGPELEVQLFVETPGFYRLFAQVQIGGVSKFVPFGLNVTK